MSLNRHSIRVSTIALLLAVLVLILGACAPQGVEPEATAPGTQEPAPQTEEPTVTQPPGTEALPETGEVLGYEELVAALQAADNPVEPVGTVDQPFFGVEGRLITVNGAEVQVYEFADETLQEAAAATINANGYIIGTAAVDWVSQPYFFSKDRLIVLYVGTDESVIELLTRVLGEPITGPDAWETEEPAGVGSEPGGAAELVDQLRAAGATVEQAGAYDQSFFDVEGQTITVNGEEVQVFEFADEAARQAAVETINANGYIIGLAALDWTTQPYFWSAGRTIVLYVGEDEATIDLLTRVLGEPIIGPDTWATEEPGPEGIEPGGAAELVDQLWAAGATVEHAGEIEQAFFGPVGQKFLVNGAEVQVFEYPDETAREADSSQISPDGSSIGTTMVTWVDDPHFWAVDRIIVLYVGSDEAAIDLLTRVLGEPIAG